MIETVTFIAGACLSLLASVWLLALLPLAQRFRTDLKPGDHWGMGSSRWWQVNVFNPRNYSTGEGQSIVRRMRLLRRLQVAGGLLMLVALWNSFDRLP